MLVANPGFWNKTQRPWHFLLEFQRLASEFGISFETVIVGEDTPGAEIAQKCEALILKADAFFIPMNSNFLTSPSLYESVHRKISDGTRTLVELPAFHEPKSAKINAFLSHYDLFVTSHRIRSYGKDTHLVSIPRKSRLLVHFRSEVSPEEFDHFRHPDLFAGVDSVCVTQPYTLNYFGNSVPLLIATEGQFVEDFASFSGGFKSVFLERGEGANQYLTCMAGHFGDNGGGIICIYGDALSDPGLSLAGVESRAKESNRKLAQNLLDWLSGRRFTRSPYNYLDSIERNLSEFVFSSLRQAHGEKLHEAFPERVRSKCEERDKNEKKGIRPWGYLDLIDLKKIVAFNKALNERAWHKLIIPDTSCKKLKWIDRLNEIRKFSAHPIKAEVSGWRASTEDLDFLRTVHRHLCKLVCR